MTRFEKRMAVGGLVVGVASLLVAVLQFGGQSGATSAAAPTPLVVKVEPQSAPPPPARLPQLLNERTIGRQLQYFEAIAGPAQEVSGRRRLYQVDGCNLEIEVGNDQQIEALSVRVTGACSFEWRDMAHNMGDLSGRPEHTTLAQFLDNVGEQSIYHLGGCTSGCGNMADPEIWLQRYGSHADGWIDMTVAVTADSMQEVDGLQRLSGLVRANLGEDATYELTGICDRRVIGWIRAAMGTMRIERVELRTQIEPNGPTSCDLSRLPGAL